MKTIRFMIIPVLILLVSCLTGRAQTTYSFTYDLAGNRESRIIPLKSAKIPADTLEAKQLEKPLEELIGNREIKIYPNPTKGLLRVEIPLANEAQATIQVFTARGALLRKIKATAEYSEIDLSRQPVGMYILRIAIGDQTSEWKIIKD